MALLEEEEDVNQLTEYFSYEHFYVIYCKFWELDSDHDLYIDQKDLARHNDNGNKLTDCLKQALIHLFFLFFPLLHIFVLLPVVPLFLLLFVTLCVLCPNFGPSKHV